ncbi:MAG TPA: HAMP domain-containing sensor histidine kinase [Candidatus Dormibacteraeota bacterium]
MKLPGWGSRLRSRRPDSAPLTSESPSVDNSLPARELLSHLEDGVVLLEAGLVRWHNPAAVRIFPGLEGGTGRSIMETIRDHRIDALAARAGQDQLEGGAEFELPVARRVVYVRAIPLDGPGLALLFRDATRLRYLETVRQQFVANLAHEMRTPLAGLDLAAQTLADELPPAHDARAFVDRVLQESQRLQAMVSNLGQLAALDDQSITVGREPFDVRAMLEELRQANQTRASQLGLRLRLLDEDGQAPLLALGDRAKAEQALQSLIDNALKFTTKGEVVLGARADETRIEITVRDTGQGIPSKDLPRIFERFYKVDQSRSAHQGSGLGLSIARHLLELQGGGISAESTPNVGTEMRVRLPRASLTRP